MFYLLDGTLQGFCDDDHWNVTPGSFLSSPGTGRAASP